MKIRFIWNFIVIVIIFSIIGCRNNDKSTKENGISSKDTFSIMKIYPHDTTCYTQGLIWFNSSLYESTGEYGKSRVRMVDIKNGLPIQEIKLKDSSIFGEGITIFKNKIYQLTWQSHKIFVYDLKTFKKEKEFDWNDEGWGITHDSINLIVSTGSSVIYFLDPDDMNIVRKINVFDNYGFESNLNELEYANNYIFSNKYLTDEILVINPKSGEIEHKLDMSGLLKKSKMQFNPLKYENDFGNVLNGIAFDSASQTFFVTGKLWPALFQIKINLK